MTAEYTYYLSWVYKRAGGLAFETGTWTYTYEVASIEAIQAVQDGLRGGGYREAVVLGCSLLSTRTLG